MVFFVIDFITLCSLLSIVFHCVLCCRFYFIVFFVIDCMLVRSLMLSVRVCHCVLLSTVCQMASNVCHCFLCNRVCAILVFFLLYVTGE